MLTEARSPVVGALHFEHFLMLLTAVFSKRTVFKFHDVFFIWKSKTIDHSHDWPVERRTYRFQIFYALIVNLNTILFKGSNSITSFSFSSSILLEDWSKNVTM